MRLIAALAVALLTTAAAGNPVVPLKAMAVPRAAHTATLLRDGRVLVIGGCTAFGCELDRAGASTELYDPARRRFAQGPRLRAPRVGHSATLLRDGTVLIAGGWDGDDLATTALRYDPKTETFRETGDMREARGGFTATPLRDGRVLFAGGSRAGSELASAELYDPGTGRFVETGSLLAARAAHGTSVLPDGRVLVVGGSRDDRVLASAEVYDPRSGRFTRAASLRTARHKLAAVLVRGGVLVVGGSSARDSRGRYATAELYELRLRRFVPVTRMNEARFKISDSVTPLASGGALVAGGGRNLELYDPARRRFRFAGRLGTALSFSTATRLPSGDVLVLGGYDSRIAVTNRAWLFRH